MSAVLKVAVIAGIRHAGGIDAVAVAVNLGRSTVGRWANLNDRDLPRADYAMVIDQLSVANGHAPAIAPVMARECGFSLSPGMVDAADGDADPLRMAAAVAQESGEAVAAVLSGAADRVWNRDELQKALAEVDGMLSVGRSLQDWLHARLADIAR